MQPQETEMAVQRPHKVLKILRIVTALLLSYGTVIFSIVVFKASDNKGDVFGFFIAGIVALLLTVIAWRFKTKMKLYILGTYLIGMGIGISFYIPEMQRRKEYEKAHYEECVRLEKERYTTIENVAKNIDGTIWTYTEVSMLGHSHWYKLVFRDGKLYFYSAFASGGEWGEPQVCERVTTKPHYYQYSIEEARYDDTGKKYICINFKSLGKYSFVPQTRTLYYEGIPLPYSLRPEDCNPWE